MFGGSVSIRGDVAVVGAIGDGDGTGSAYVYRFDGAAWVEEAKLTASDGAARDRFGSSVSIAGDLAVVGSTGDDDNGPSSGSAYIYRQDGAVWVEQAKLTASDGAAGDFFGVSVSITGDVAVVGAFRDDDNGSDSGSAYVIDLNCPSDCPADLDGDGDIDFDDLLRVLDAWGNKGGPEDVDESGFVDFGDILIVLSSWGPCE